MGFEAIIDVLRRRIGRDDLVPDADGRVRLEVEGVVSIVLGPAEPDGGPSSARPTRIAMSAALDELGEGGLDGAVGLPRLRALLHANAGGSDVGAARLGMAADGSVALLRTLHVGDLDARGEEALIEGVMAFMNLAAYWQTTGSDRVMAFGAMPRVVPVEDWDQVRLVRV